MRWIRGIVWILLALLGVWMGLRLGWSPVFSAIVAALMASLVVLFEHVFFRLSPRDLAALGIGILLGSGVANLVAGLTLVAFHPLREISDLWFLFWNLVGIYFFGSFFFHHREHFRFARALFRMPRGCTPKIIDTSAIIDGRLIGVVRTGFLEGDLIIPRFVVEELQRIADAKDPLRRAKGRRGMDLLKELQEMKGVKVHIIPDEVPGIREVDHKLIAVAKRRKGKLVTVDYNLNKAAQIQGVPVLNLNALAQELRPQYLPGDRMTLLVQRPGKEAGQGVGYLEDGTMVVVEEGEHLIGETIEAEVVTVLQTDAGRIIFVRPLKKEKER